ncbi:hypothetical protein IGS67_10025 [Flavimobilis sp. GY10621]|uniref:Uncharacterized protein n=1 Tax=Flavimobilis rhizosphaerae TaxID=2775421 RepID=A0ABR9DRR5_9MICO|nr:hypothetical protein [Flavimobilis rhizosphaerae]MBD9699827.1 hypothetical protein [Flavimobilis rhizosphaerae]
MATAAAASAGTDRAARALAALRTAEERTGARRVTLTDVAPVVVGHSRGAARNAAPAPQQQDPVHRPATSMTRTPQRAPAPPLGVRTAERPPLPVPPALADVLPEGLRRGTVTQVTGSAALVLEMLAHVETQRVALGDEPWTAVVGCPALGLVAAAEAGVSLDRLLLVPTPGLEAATVLAALVDGVDIVVIGDVGLTEADRRRLVARARERGVAILAVRPWPGARAVLEVTGVRWRGIGAGEGRLRSRELHVARVEAGRTRRAHVALVLPAPGDGYDVTTPDVRPGAVPATATDATSRTSSSTEPATPGREGLPAQATGPTHDQGILPLRPVERVA